jgi:MFS family permease
MKLGTNYWKLWTSSVVPNFGDGTSLIAYPWLASALTRDPFQIALIAVVQRIPWLIFSLPAGVITDRVDRRKLIAWMDVIRFGMTLIVAFLVLGVTSDLSTPAEIAAGNGTPPPGAGWYLVMLYVATLVFGIAEVFRDNAAQTLMPAVVDHSLLEKANGRMWGAEMVMNSFVGPPLGGVFIAIAFSLPFFLDAVTFGLAALLIFTITGSFAANGSTERRSFKEELTEGVKWLWNHRLLRSMGIILGFMNGLFMVALATYVLFVQEILGLNASSFGLLMTSGAVGGVLGSVTASNVSGKIGQGASLFTTLIVSSLTLLITGLTSSPVVVWVMFALGSYVAVLWNVITVALRQTIIPDRLLGRVNSVYRFFAWGMMPIGSIIGGLLVVVTDALGSRDLALRMPFIFSAVTYALLYFFALPRLNSRRIDEAKADAEAAATDNAMSETADTDTTTG